MSVPDAVLESIRAAGPEDLDKILPLMRGYYRDDGLAFNELRARNVLFRLLSESQWGGVLIAEISGVAIAYAALCVGFSMELGGNDAFVDELFVAPEYRGRGIAKRLLDSLEDLARSRGVQALHMEVDKRNVGAQKMYDARLYFARDRYHLLTKVLD